MNIKKIYPYLIAIGIFVVASILYFHPVLKGDKMIQSDITQFRGMAKEIQDFRAETGEEPYWTGSAFSGMPAFQLSAYYPHDYVDYLDRLVRFLPRPADYLFLYFLSFFILLTALKVDWKLAVLGSLAFGFSTYLIIIFGAGHNAKAHAIGYMPLVAAGVIWVFQKRYLLGFTITSLAVALEIKVNHPQMTYYLFFALLILGIVELIDAVKKKEFPIFIKQAFILIIAATIGVGVNSSRLLSMKEYADASTRGKSELTINPDGSEKEATSGLDKDYITQYSYDIPETFNLMVPRYMGGGTVEKLHDDSHTYEFVKSLAGKKQADGFTEQVLTYWGKQPIIEAPAYIGAVMFFLFFLGIVLVKGKLKYWLFGAVLFSLILSWGKNFSLITNFFIDYIPLYNKFRAVSSIQVIAELCVPILGVLALKEFFAIYNQKQRIEAIKKAAYISGGVLILGLLYAFSSATFEGLRDANYSQYKGLLDSIVADRKAMLYSDTFRSFVLIAFSGGILWLFAKHKLNQTRTIVLIGLLLLFDLLSINLNYVNSDDFQSPRKVERPFSKTEADKLILQDKTHYRVANLTVNMMEEGSTSYFHKSIGGYHAAKMGRYSELIDFQFSKNNREVFNMLNTKYFILGTKASEVKQNPDANGNVWFVNELQVALNANQEILALDSLQTKEKAVIDINELKEKYPNNSKTIFEQDSTAVISLKNYSLTELTYESISQKDQFAVFSEIYYGKGWNAYLDGKLVPHVRVNYVLRGMHVPYGNHKITFKFEPEVIKRGSAITLTSYAFLLLIPFGWYFFEKKKKKA